MIDGAIQRLLGRHVRRSARSVRGREVLAAGSRPRASRVTRQPVSQSHIQQLHCPLRRDNYVVGSEIAVREASRMYVGQRISKLQGNLGGVPRIDGATRCECRERIASYEVANEIRRIPKNGFVNRGHAGVEHSARRPRASKQSSNCGVVTRELRPNDRQRNGSSRARVASLVPFPDTVGSQTVEDLVLTHAFVHVRTNYTGAFSSKDLRAG
jgi:hypothetical protein